MQLADSPITRRQHRLARELNEEKRAQDRSPSSLALSLDTQCCILALFACDDLGRFSAISCTCHSVATLDRLWVPLLAENLKDDQVGSWFGACTPIQCDCSVRLFRLQQAHPNQAKGSLSWGAFV
jgi:hypothetical protein